MSILKSLINKGFLKKTEITNPLVVALRISAIPIAKIGLTFKINPNFLTLLGFIIGLISIYALSKNFYLIFISLWTLSCIIDYADGIVARNSKKVSHFGYLFDMITDRIRLILLLMVCSQISNTIMILCIIAILFQVLCDIVLHLFIPNKDHIQSSSNFKNLYLTILHETIFIVNMHSFFIFGFFVYFGSNFLIYGLMWLVLILFLDLKKAFYKNIYYSNSLNLNFNKNLISKFLK